MFGATAHIISHDLNSPGFGDTQTRFSRVLNETAPQRLVDETLSQTHGDLDMSVMMPLNLQAEEAPSDRSLGKSKKGKKKLFQRRRRPSGAEALARNDVQPEEVK